MVTRRTIGEYDHCKEDWVSYCERLEHYFAANDVDDAGEQQAILLSVCGATTYQLIRNLVAPPSPPSVRDCTTVQFQQWLTERQRNSRIVWGRVAKAVGTLCIPRQVGRHAMRSPSMWHQRFTGAATPTVRDKPHFQENV